MKYVFIQSCHLFLIVKGPYDPQSKELGVLIAFQGSFTHYSHFQNFYPPSQGHTLDTLCHKKSCASFSFFVRLRCTPVCRWEHYLLCVLLTINLLAWLEISWSHHDTCTRINHVTLILFKLYCVSGLTTCTHCQTLPYLHFWRMMALLSFCIAVAVFGWWQVGTIVCRSSYPF